MQRIALCSMLLLAVHEASAAGVVRIANGDCNALQQAAASPPGLEPALIVLAANGSYGACGLNVSGNIVIDGAGANVSISAWNHLSGSLDSVDRGAKLTLRNINLGPAPVATAASTKGGSLQPQFPVLLLQPISNQGTLTLDTVSVSGVANDVFTGWYAIVENSGTMVMRNVTMTGNTGNLIDNTGTVEISHSTLAGNQGFVQNESGGTIRIANSVLVNNGPASCVGAITSLGGNITDDASCRLNSTNDHVVTDAKLGAFATHGGVTGSVALSFDSPAIGNGLAANCEAADARGDARGTTSCDSGAYEFGGGQGKIGVSGTSGLYFNHENNGHYVTVQRVFDDNALVIWNTFDENGKPAWMYGVGAINGGSIHVEQVAENLGGILQPGGAVSGVTPTLWGTFDLDVSSCYTATLNYHSVLPQFGNGTVHLERLAFVTGLDCSQ